MKSFNIEQFTTPNLVAIDKACFYLDTGLAPDLAENMHLGTWLACQAAVELGPEATDDDIEAHALSALKGQEWRTVGVYAAVASCEIVDGEYGRVIPEELYAGLQRMVGTMRALAEHNAGLLDLAATEA